MICKHCNQDMQQADGCIEVQINYHGSIHKPVKYGEETGAWSGIADESPRCTDCGVKKGQYHHPGCDVERCPLCEGQILSCGCGDEEEEY